MASEWHVDTVTALVDPGRSNVDLERRRVLAATAYSMPGLALPGQTRWDEAPDRAPLALPGHRAATSTLRRALPARVKPVLKPLISGPSMPPGPVTPPPGSSTATRGGSHAGPEGRRPQLRSHENGNGWGTEAG